MRKVVKSEEGNFLPNATSFDLTKTKVSTSTRIQCKKAHILTDIGEVK